MRFLSSYNKILNHSSMIFLTHNKEIVRIDLLSVTIRLSYSTVFVFTDSCDDTESEWVVLACRI